MLFFGLRKGQFDFELKMKSIKNIFFSLILLLAFFDVQATKWYVNDATTIGDIYCSAAGSEVIQAVSLTSGSNISGTLNSTNFAKFNVGDYVTGSGLPVGTYIVSKNSFKLTFSNNATSNGISPFTS